MERVFRVAGTIAASWGFPLVMYGGMWIMARVWYASGAPASAGEQAIRDARLATGLGDQLFIAGAFWLCHLVTLMCMRPDGSSFARRLSASAVSGGLCLAVLVPVSALLRVVISSETPVWFVVAIGVAVCVAATLGGRRLLRPRG